MAFDAGCKDAFEIPGFVPEYIRRCSAKARGRFAGWRCRATRMILERPTISRSNFFLTTQTLNRWLRLSRDRIQFQGLPARICWLGYGERAEMGEAINELVRRGDLKAPIANWPAIISTPDQSLRLSRNRRNERRIGCGG